MRKFLGIVALFFALAFSLLLSSSANQVQAIQTSDTIQVKKEIVELISNSFLDGKTSSYKEKNSKKYFSYCFEVLERIPVKILYQKFFDLSNFTCGLYLIVFDYNVALCSAV